MYLYVGSDHSIPIDRVIAVVDVGSLKREPATLAFLERAKARREMRDVSGGAVASYVITDTVVYASSVAPATIKRRAERGHGGWFEPER